MAPEPVWRDVTAEFQTSADNDLIFDGCAMWLPYSPHNKGRYRLRKVPANYVQDGTNIFSYAFIIERKEQP